MVGKFNYKKGLIDGIPICLAYLAVSFTFGVEMTSLGFSPFFATMISATNLTSAGQFAGIKMIATEAFFLEVFLAVFVINARYILMSLSLSQSLPEKTSTLKRAIMSMFVTDEIFAVASSSGKNLNFKYFWGLGTLPYLGWTIGTLVGGFVNSILPVSLQTALGIALYCMFIAIILPTAKKSGAVCFCIGLAVALSCALYYIPVINTLSFGIQIIISSVASSVVTALLFPIKETEEKEKEEDEEVQNA